MMDSQLPLKTDRPSVRAGVDIIEVRRIACAIRSRGTRFIDKLYTGAESAYCEARANKWQSYAARYAAKEAVAKVLGTGFRGFLPRDIEITQDEYGCPRVVLRGAALDAAQSSGIRFVDVSMSHVADYAIAFAVAEVGD